MIYQLNDEANFYYGKTVKIVRDYPDGLHIVKLVDNPAISFAVQKCCLKEV